MAILEELKAKANGSADQANNIQEAISMMEFGGGSSGGIMVINETDDTLDKTWQEIYDAMAQGKMCVIRKHRNAPDGEITTGTVISEYNYGDDKYTFKAGTNAYTASSATEYPVVGGVE